ncbi:MAG: hypothetical protein DSZ06_00330 [Sulfurospirillum sp.]|nr:MAG: hypothetical protein DSZ06_00330 [Sulfurospirillum sp.]
MEAINEITSLSIWLFIVLTLFVTSRIFLLLKSKKDLQTFSKIYERWTLFFRALLGALFFSGVVVMAIEHFHSRVQVWLMLIFALILLAGTIKESTLYQKTGIGKNRENELFFGFCKKFYIFAIIGILSIAIISQVG